MKVIKSLFFIIVIAHFNVHCNNPSTKIEEKTATSIEDTSKSVHETDPKKPELDEFKDFAKTFFLSLKKKDTSYLKDHIIFPIPNSSFSLYDPSLQRLKEINSKTFFEKLDKIFPYDLIEEIDNAQYIISDPIDGEILYTVTVYTEEGGVESNCRWIFIRKSSVFYLSDFICEAG